MGSDNTEMHLQEHLQKLQPEHIKALRITILIWMFIVCGVFGFVFFIMRDEARPILFFAMLVSFFILLFMFYPKKVYDYTRYGLVDKVFYVQKGKWFRKRTAVAQNRIQHTDVEQGPIQRKYNLATLILHTAGMAEANIRVAGLKHVDAVALRDYLLLLNKQALLDKSSDSVHRTTKYSKSQGFDMQPGEQAIATSVLALRISEEE